MISKVHVYLRCEITLILVRFRCAVFIKSIYIPKMALKNCNNPLVCCSPVSEVVVLVAGDGTPAQEVSGRSIMNRVTKTVDRHTGKTRKRPGWDIKGAPNAR
jgi:hypothetical protein